MRKTTGQVYYMNSTFYYGNITVKVKFFENLEYLSNKINAENNIRLWNPEHWFLTKTLIQQSSELFFFNKRNIKRNINEQIPYSFLTNFSGCTVNNKLIILILSSNKIQ